VRPETFPVGLVLRGLQVVVIGNGPEAVARATALREAGARVVLVADHPSE
jgi:siroheme synthase (precorrin-2 oxidase/ferrochelatase)